MSASSRRFDTVFIVHIIDILAHIMLSVHRISEECSEFDAGAHLTIVFLPALVVSFVAILLICAIQSILAVVALIVLPLVRLAALGASCLWRLIRDTGERLLSTMLDKAWAVVVRVSTLAFARSWKLSVIAMRYSVRLARVARPVLVPVGRFLLRIAILGASKFSELAQAVLVPVGGILLRATLLGASQLWEFAQAIWDVLDNDEPHTASFTSGIDEHPPSTELEVGIQVAIDANVEQPADDVKDSPVDIPAGAPDDAATANVSDDNDDSIGTECELGDRTTAEDDPDATLFVDGDDHKALDIKLILGALDRAVPRPLACGLCECAPREPVSAPPPLPWTDLARACEPDPALTEVAATLARAVLQRLEAAIRRARAEEFRVRHGMRKSASKGKGKAWRARERVWGIKQGLRTGAGKSAVLNPRA